MTHLTTRHGRVFLTVAGPVDGLTVVLTHGLTMDHRTYASQIEALRGTHQVIAWDLPGHGDSSPLAPEDFRFEVLTEVLLDLLDTLGIKSAVLVGQSVASLFHQYFAWHHPTRVAGLVDIGGLPLHLGRPLPLSARGVRK